MNSKLQLQHSADLEKSGLGDDTIADMGVFSLSVEEIEEHIGFCPTGATSGYLIPYPGTDGFGRVKLFGVDEPKYLQPKDSDVRLYVPASVLDILHDNTTPIWITEGEKKAAKLTQEGFPCVGLGGVWAWVRKGSKEPIDDLATINWVERDVVLVPDSDIWTRPDLLHSIYALAKAIERRGGKIRIVMVPGAKDGKVGVDDYLVTHGVDKFKSLKSYPMKHAAFAATKLWYDKWLKQPAKTEDESEQSTGAAALVQDVEPAEESVDGDALMHDLVDLYQRYVVLPPGAAVAIALWTLFTYAIDAFSIAPILAFLSAVKRSGKTKALTVLQHVAYKALSTSNISPAALFRIVEMFHPTLEIDEADSFVKVNEEMRGILNAGHSRATAYVVRCVGQENIPRPFNVFCPKAFGGIGNLPDTVMDRSIVIAMSRRRPTDQVASLRDKTLVAEGAGLRRRCRRWALDNLKSLEGAEPIVPTELNDREADNWRPLLALAEQIGPLWAMRARKAAQQLRVKLDDSDDVRIQLLQDIRWCFDSFDSPLTSATLVAHLCHIEGRPWAEWRFDKPMTPNQLAAQLRPFGIRPVQLNLSVKNPRGYHRGLFANAFTAYLAGIPPTPPSKDEPLYFPFGE